MPTRTWVSWLVVLLASLAACHGARTHAAPRKAGGFYNEGGDGDARGGSGNRGDVVTLDDLSNALQGQRTRDWRPTVESTQGTATTSDDSGRDITPAVNTPAERLLTYHGQIRIEVARTEDAIAQFLAQVKEWGGYLQSQQGTTITVRLPAARFDEAFTKLRAAGRVLGETRQADDVTEEFVDLGIRLDNAKKARDRLLAVLERADKVEDILKVEAELRRLTEEIERMEGRKKFLADQVAMATLQVVFSAVDEAPVGRPSRRPSRFWWINEIGAESVMEGF